MRCPVARWLAPSSSASSDIRKRSHERMDPQFCPELFITTRATPFQNPVHGKARQGAHEQSDQSVARTRVREHASTPDGPVSASRHGFRREMPLATGKKKALTACKFAS